jgi:hypothetical protein
MTARVKKIGKAEKPTAGLEAECARLRAELARVTEERDGYLKSIYALMWKDPPDPPFEPEELSTMVKVDLSEIIPEPVLNEKNHLCPNPRVARSKSAGLRKTVKR